MRIHFIAIGGSAMHNLALTLHDMGHEVTGSDDEIKDPSRGRLAAAGLLPDTMGWDPSRITEDLEAVILGMHARKDNPELKAALDLGLPVQSYPEFLFNATANKHRVVVGGSHGKTTITSMVLHVLSALDRPTDYMVGAQLDGFDRMVALHEDNDMVLLEGDEYLSSPIDSRSKFLWYAPQTALLTSIAWDHINVFPTEADYVATFKSFVATLPEGATLVHCASNAPLNDLLQSSPRKDLNLVPYTAPENIEASPHGATLHWPDGSSCQTTLRGSHNFENLAGARALCKVLGIAPGDFDSAIANFTGAARRLEETLDDPTAQFTVFRDFAHAPSKLLATTSGMAESYPDRKLVAVFELHTFSSLNPTFLPTYAGCMDAASTAIVYFDPDVLVHKKLPPLDSDQIRDAFGRDDLQIFTDAAALEAVLRQLPARDTVVLMMSSGWFGGISWPGQG